MTASTKRFALVMPVRNEEDAVAETLDAVFASTRLPDEIIVSDALSTDATLARVRQYGGRGVPLRIVSNPSLWCGGGRNVAVEATDCDVIILGDFGNTFEPDYIEHVARVFEEDDEVEIVGGMFRMRARGDFEHCVAAIHYHEDYTLDRLSRDEIRRLLPDVILPGGLCTSFTRRIWLAAGRQPEWLAKGQDKMFSRKVHAIGGKAAVALDARVWHHVRSTPGALFRQVFLYGRGNGQMRFVSKHAVKLALVYGAILALFALGLALHGGFAAAAVVLVLAYFWRAGLRKVMIVDGGFPSWRRAGLAAVVLFVRDIGSLLGHAVGWAEWFTVPRYRENFQRYTGGVPSGRLSILAPEMKGRRFVDRMRRLVGAT